MVQMHEVFSTFVDHKFSQLNKDCNGNLSVKELHPAVADIGAALGFPAQGSSADSDYIYYEVLNEFTHGKQEVVSKSEFKEVLSDILLGMAAGLKRDPVVILRIDGEDLHEFINGPTFESEMVSLFSELDLPDGASLRDYIIKGLQKLKVDQGMPPASDSWVMNTIIEPALQSCDDQQVSQGTFLAEFKRIAGIVAINLNEQHVIVAHSEYTFDGSCIKRLLSNKFELDKTLEAAVQGLPKDKHGKIPKEYLHVAFKVFAPSVGLPPFGAVDEMDKVIGEVFKMLDVEDGNIIKENEFKKLLLEILGSIMLQLDGNPISVSRNSVVHEPTATSSSILSS